MLTDSRTKYEGVLVAVSHHKTSHWMYRPNTAILERFSAGGLFFIKSLIQGLVNSRSTLELSDDGLVVWDNGSGPWFELRSNADFTIGEPGGDDPFYLGKLSGIDHPFDFQMFVDILGNVAYCMLLPLGRRPYVEMGLHIVTTSPVDLVLDWGISGAMTIFTPAA